MLRRRLIALLAVLTVVGLAYVLLFTPSLGVRSIEVSGIDRVDKATVLELARIPDRRAMLRIDTDGAEQRIAKLPQVERVVVARSWPSTVTIEVTERVPVTYFRAYDGIRLVDRSGVPFHRVSKPPKKLPELKVSTVASTDPATRAATTVLSGLPPKLAKRVKQVAARTPGSVELTLAGGKVVRWGNTGQSDRKARVLDALLPRKGEYYDVSSPELPTVR